MALSVAGVLRTIVRGGILALAAGVPVIALPWTASALDVNKQAFFLLVSAVVVVAWLGEAVVERRVELRLSWWWGVLAAFLVATGISAARSLDRYTSILGQAEQEYMSLVTILMLAAVTFVAVHVLDAAMRRRVVLWSMIAAAVVSIVALSTFFSVSLGAIPTNLIGMPNSLALYLVIMSALGCMAMVHADAFSRATRAVMVVTSAITVAGTVIVLLAIDYALLWGVALAAALAVFALALLRLQHAVHPWRFLAPMVLLVTSLFFLVLPTFLPNPFRAEVGLNTSSTWAIATNAMQDGAWAFGTGPGTFSILFAEHRSEELNQSTFWNTQFDRGSSGLLTMLPTFGLFATAFFVVALCVIAVWSVRSMVQGKHEHVVFVLPAWMASVVVFVVYPHNVALTFLLWLLTALILSELLPHAKSISLQKSPRVGMLAVLCFVLFGVFALTVGFATIARYRAEIAFARAIAIDRAGGNVDDVILALDRAATLNRWSDVYYRNLGSALLQKLIATVQLPDANPEYVKSLVGAAVNAGVRATELGPNTATNWEIRGDISREVSPLVSDGAQLAVLSYERASALAPKNPKYFVKIARAYIALADVQAALVRGDDEQLVAEAVRVQDESYARAHDALMTAIALKPDYVEARYYLAFVQERQEKLAEAITSMELVRNSAPNDLGVGLQLALLYLRQGKNDLAQRELNRVIAIAPNFANAHWYLASVLEEAGDVDGAIAELEIIMSLDAANETVQKKLDALRAGKVVPDPIPDPLPTPEESTTPTP